MGVVSDVLIKDYKGTPAGTRIQVLNHAQMVEMGFFNPLDPEVEAAKKKPSKKKQAARDAEADIE